MIRPIHISLGLYQRAHCAPLLAFSGPKDGRPAELVGRRIHIHVRVEQRLDAPDSSVDRRVPERGPSVRVRLVQPELYEPDKASPSLKRTG